MRPTHQRFKDLKDLRISMAPGRPETVPRDLPDCRTWLPGLAQRRQETLPREDPADPGSGGQNRTGLEPQALWTGGGQDFWDSPPCYKSFGFRNLEPRPRNQIQDPKPRTQDRGFQVPRIQGSRYTGLAEVSQSTLARRSKGSADSILGNYTHSRTWLLLVSP